MSILSAPHFHNEAAAFERVEKVIWPQGPVCHHCGCMGRISAIPANPEKRVRYGLKRCGDCKQQFTVRMGTIFEESKLPLHIWLQAMHLMCSSKKGVSAHQLHRTLEITYKSAWFLAHRIREAMRSGNLAPFGTDGGIVEVDETFIGVEPGEPKAKAGGNHKMKVLALVDRTTGAGGVDMHVQLLGHAQGITGWAGRGGLGHCWADAVIDAIAATAITPGGLPQWVGYSVNRHIENTRAVIP